MITSLDEARALDATDPLRSFRDEFYFPPPKKSERVSYLVGHSLGLQPKKARSYVDRELAAWAKHGVEGHFYRGNDNDDPIEPWFSYHELFLKNGASLVGAKPGEVVAMGTLTTNLHLLMVSFYRPTTLRSQIVIEAGAFPSDRYAVASQARFHGYDPAQTVVELKPREGEDLLRTDDILRFIDEHGDRVALFLLSGVNYYTGQLFDIRTITKAARAKGITVGWDLAHAAGNVLLSLHDDDVDFAAWCTYKYLNSGPGSVAMAFVHERHARAFDLPRFCGWWGSDPSTRFLMGPKYEPQPGAAGWQLSNAPVLSMAALHASLELFERATMKNLRAKSERLTSALLEIVDTIPSITVITPRDPAARGAQLSLRTNSDPQRFLALLAERDVYADFRHPDVIRVAPTPLYNSFEDVWRFGEILRESATSR